jgi:hypothetical protein
MKGLGELVLGCIAGGLLGAAAFFAVDALMPTGAKAACYTEQCNPYSEYQNPYSEYQNPYSEYQNPYSEYQNKYSDKYIPSCKKTGAC